MPTCSLCRHFRRDMERKGFCGYSRNNEKIPANKDANNCPHDAFTPK